MIQKRLTEEDCNAGAMFDCLTSENWPDDKFAISAIFEACGRQNVQVVIFKHLLERPEEAETDTKYEVCVNYRYAQRHDPQHQKLSDNVKAGDKDKSKTVDFKKTATIKSKNVTSSSKISKANSLIKKETKTETETETKPPNPEQEKKAKELEAKRRRAENLMKQGFKPPVYSEDEKKDWRLKVDDYYAFCADLIKAADALQGDDAKYGFRRINEQSIHYDLLFTCEDLKKIVHEPQWPDPDNEPLPPPLINSI